MGWQSVDWFFVAVFLAFIAMLFVNRQGSGASGGTAGQRPSSGRHDDERPGPTINM